MIRRFGANNEIADRKLSEEELRNQLQSLQQQFATFSSRVMSALTQAPTHCLIIGSGPIEPEAAEAARKVAKRGLPVIRFNKWKVDAGVPDIECDLHMCCAPPMSAAKE